MVRRYTGGFISTKEQVSDVNTANGVFTLSEHQERTALGNFPTGRWTPSRSLRFRGASSTYLNRSAYPVLSAGTQYTVSLWIKRTDISATQDLFSFVSTAGDGQQAGIQIEQSSYGGALRWWQYEPTGGYQWHKVTSAVLRDASAWYHLVLTYDSSLAVAEDRCQIFINGVRQTSFQVNVNPSQNRVTYYKTGTLYPYIGAENRNNSSALAGFNGYMTEFNFIDGQSLPPTEFGFTDPETGTWVPKRYTGTYGSGGFYLPFLNNTGLDQLGRDFGNGGSELITNGFFDANVSGWSTWPGVGGSPFITWQSTGRARIGNTQNNGSIYYQAITTEIGRTYYATASVSNISIGANGRTCALQWASSLGGVATTIGSIAQPNSGIISGSFVATSTTSYILLNVDVLGSGTQGADWDSVSVSDTSIKNHWNANNFSLTSGQSYDSFVDVPGIAAVSSQADVGGVVRGNYATINGADLANLNGGTVTWGGLRTFGVFAGGSSLAYSTIPLSSGKWYYEIFAESNAGNGQVYAGVRNIDAAQNTGVWLGSGGNYTSYGFYGVAVDVDSGRAWLRLPSGSWATGVPDTGTPTFTFSISPGQNIIIAAFTSRTSGFNDAGYGEWNFGQKTFNFTPPSSYRSINTTNLPNPVIRRPSDHFDIKTYTGNGNSQVIGTTNKQTTNYQIPRSLRFRSSNSAFLSRTPTSSGSLTTWTFSAWVKLGSTSVSQTILAAGLITASPILYHRIAIGSDGSIGFFNYPDTGPSAGWLWTAKVLRDSSAWYHLVFVWNTTNTSPSERMQIYVNGTRITSFVTNTFAPTFPNQNTQSLINNSAYSHRIGRTESGQAGGNFLDSNLTEVNFIDGQALTPTSFGQYDANNNWIPIRYTGTYGTNGYYLPFNTNTLDTNVTLNATATAPFGGVAADARTDNGVYFTSNTSTGSSFFALRYDFGTQTQITRAALSAAYFTGGTSATWAIWGSNDDTNYTAITSFGVTNAGTNYSFNINANFRYYYLRATNFGTNGQVVLDGFTLYQDGIGLDSSSNGNNWTPNNFSVTAGATNDSLLDSPTDYDDGSGNIRGNYCILDANTKGSFVTLSNAGLTTAGNTATNSGLAMGTLAVSIGKWYWEMTATTAGQISYMGVAKRNSAWSTLDNVESFGNNNHAMIMRTNGELFGMEKVAASTTSFTNGDVMACALDMDSGALYISKNGTWLNSGNPVSGSAKTGALFTWGPGSSGYELLTPLGGGYNGNLNHFNFGQRAFTYTPPAGFRSINTKNLKDVGSFNLPDTFGNFVNTADLIWIKNRTAASNGDHGWYDVIRGPQADLRSNSTALSTVYNGFGVQDFIPNGFSIAGNGTVTNTSNDRFVAWCWNRGAIPGFDIVSYRGNLTTNVVNHNLGAVPKFIIVKQITGTVRNWFVYHHTLGPTQCFEGLNTTSGVSTQAAWNNTAPTSNTFTLGNNNGTNDTGGAYIAYLWAEVPGFSKFGSYTGNGSTNGPYIYTGFRPRWVMIKRTDAVNDWIIYDTARQLFNTGATADASNFIRANTSAAEDIDPVIDCMSNGFKTDGTAAFHNASGGNYIYAAFAEYPFKYANAR